MQHFTGTTVQTPVPSVPVGLSNGAHARAWVADRPEDPRHWSSIRIVQRATGNKKVWGEWGSRLRIEFLQEAEGLHLRMGQGSGEAFPILHPRAVRFALGSQEFIFE